MERCKRWSILRSCWRGMATETLAIFPVSPVAVRRLKKAVHIFWSRGNSIHLARGDAIGRSLLHDEHQLDSSSATWNFAFKVLSSHQRRYPAAHPGPQYDPFFQDQLQAESRLKQLMVQDLGDFILPMLVMKELC